MLLFHEGLVSSLGVTHQVDKSFTWFKKNHESLISKLLIAILITMFIFNNLSTLVFT